RPTPVAPRPMFFSDVPQDPPPPVMAGNATAGLNPHLAGREVDLVMEHHNVRVAKLVKMRGFGDRAAGLVHVCARQQQQHALATQRSFRRYALKAPPPGTDAVALGDRVERHETDIVSIAGVLRTGITEPDEEQHEVLSIRSCPRQWASWNLG